jgi:hypothetical protein
MKYSGMISLLCAQRAHKTWQLLCIIMCAKSAQNLTESLHYYARKERTKPESILALLCAQRAQKTWQHPCIITRAKSAENLRASLHYYVRKERTKPRASLHYYVRKERTKPRASLHNYITRLIVLAVSEPVLSSPVLPIRYYRHCV